MKQGNGKKRGASLRVHLKVRARAAFPPSLGRHRGRKKVGIPVSRVREKGMEKTAESLPFFLSRH